MAHDIARWLEGLGLGQYVEAFAENDIEFKNISRLTEDDLKELGLSIGHRRTLQAAIDALSTVDPTVRLAAPPPGPQHSPSDTQAEAERRQLTVMFCDLVGSTTLSSQLDPENMRDVIRSYQDACASVVTRYDGFVAKYMGDGVLVYAGHDPGVCSRTFSSCAQVLLGRIEQAEGSLEEARELAKSLSHPASMGSALGFAGMAFQMRRDATRALHYAESAIRHCEEAGLDRLLWMSASMVVRGWSLAVLGSDAAAIAEIERGISQWTASGTTFCYPYLLGLLADAQGHLGRRDEAYSTALKALEGSGKIGEPWWRPELYRIIGHFQQDISRDMAGDAEASFQNSIRSAQGLEAKTLELRGSVSLARLWQSQGKTTEAHDLLAPVHDWFTEGFDTADLKEAKALLEQIR